jgi:uncharacterized protein YgiM (DUF1202 family)
MLGGMNMNVKKTTRALVLALVLALALASAASAAVKMGVIRMPTTNGSVHVRSGRGTGYAIRGWAFHGDRVIILSKGSKWDNVRVVKTGLQGYVFNKYIVRMVDVTSLANWGTMARIKTKYATSTVALRTGPSTSYDAEQYLTPANALAILGKYGNWYEVQLVPSLTTGYVFKDYITNGAYGVTTAAGVNLRKSGSSSSKVLATAPVGANITILKIGSKWSKLIYNGKTGYMYNKYIGVTNIAP